MNVEEVMTPREEIVTVELPGTRDDALKYLQEREFSSVPVVKHADDGEVYRGIVSRERLIEQPEEDQLALLLEEVPTVARGATLSELAALMTESGQRRIPVVDGRLEGIVTVTDLVRALAEGRVPGGDEPVGSLATREVVATYEGTPLPAVQRQLYLADRPYHVVLDGEGEMVGIVTEVDILDEARVVVGEEGTGDSIASQDAEWMWEGIKAVGNRYLPTRYVEIPEKPVREYMTADVETTTKRTHVETAAQTMLSLDIEQLPLISGDDLVGIVRDMDLIRAIHD
ncbi:MAG: CBS domain-containing protein [Halobacteriales archaeon]